MDTQRISIRLLLCSFSIAFCLPISSIAQRGWWGGSNFSKGDNVLSAGVGFGMDYGYVPAAPNKPYFIAAIDHGAIETGLGTIGIGGIASYKAVKHRYSTAGNTEANWSNLTLGARATMHFSAVENLVSNLDAYGGVMLGARMWSYHNDYLAEMGGSYPTQGIRPVSGMFAGLRYSIGERVGVWVEGGWDVAAVKGGVALKF